MDVRSRLDLVPTPTAAEMAAGRHFARRYPPVEHDLLDVSGHAADLGDALRPGSPRYFDERRSSWTDARCGLR